MRYQMYSIFDQAVKTFLPPDYLKTDAEAIRKFEHNVNNQEMGFLFTKPQHYDLYFVGIYDDDTGKFESDTPKHLLNGAQIKSTEDAKNQMRIAGT